MGDDPRVNVVDTNCHSWDIRNLWVCDGSVFPTVGGVNPPLTIQAITCRTADRIKRWRPAASCDRLQRYPVLISAANRAGSPCQTMRACSST
jgi:choline dehydrogenase-like flavoprotein